MTEYIESNDMIEFMEDKLKAWETFKKNSAISLESSQQIIYDIAESFLKSILNYVKYEANTIEYEFAQLVYDQIGFYPYLTCTNCKTSFPQKEAEKFKVCPICGKPVIKNYNMNYWIKGENNV